MDEDKDNSYYKSVPHIIVIVCLIVTFLIAMIFSIEQTELSFKGESFPEVVQLWSEGDNYKEFSTGVIISRNRVLTVAHGTTDKKNHRIVLDDGREFNVSLVEYGTPLTNNDWAVFRVEDARNLPRNATLSCGEYKLSERAVIVGFHYVQEPIKRIFYDRISALDSGSHGPFSHSHVLSHINVAVGMSGSPIYSLRGKVKGIVTATLHPSLQSSHMTTSLFTKIPDALCVDAR